ncbi:MAG: archaetidylserine decarboxylase [Bdellovibrionota bacterium]
MNYLVNLMKLLPKNLISLLVGQIAQIRWPSPIKVWLNKAFVAAFRINMHEAEFPIARYNSIEGIFTRKLQPGVRPIDGGVVVPSDGYISFSGPTRNDRALQAKGHYYSTEELVFGVQGPESRKFDAAWATTVYLAPHNYHRVHSPVGGILREVIYHPGELWPVNPPFVQYVPNIFARNERLTFVIEWEPNIYVYAVMVGALNVGRISTRFNSSFTTNSAKRLLGLGPSKVAIKKDQILLPGDELGTFMLGSTVVLVFDRDFVKKNSLIEINAKKGVRMGQSLLAPEIEGNRVH